MGRIRRKNPVILDITVDEEHFDPEEIGDLVSLFGDDLFVVRAETNEERVDRITAEVTARAQLSAQEAAGGKAIPGSRLAKWWNRFLLEKLRQALDAGLDPELLATLQLSKGRLRIKKSTIMPENFDAKLMKEEGYSSGVAYLGSMLYDAVPETIQPEHTLLFSVWFPQFITAVYESKNLNEFTENLYNRTLELEVRFSVGCAPDWPRKVEEALGMTLADLDEEGGRFLANAKQLLEDGVARQAGVPELLLSGRHQSFHPAMGSLYNFDPEATGSLFGVGPLPGCYTQGDPAQERPLPPGAFFADDPETPSNWKYQLMSLIGEDEITIEEFHSLLARVNPTAASALPEASEDVVEGDRPLYIDTLISKRWIIHLVPLGGDDDEAIDFAVDPGWESAWAQLGKGHVPDNVATNHGIRDPANKVCICWDDTRKVLYKALYFNKKTGTINETLRHNDLMPPKPVLVIEGEDGPVKLWGPLSEVREQVINPELYNPTLFGPTHASGGDGSHFVAYSTISMGKVPTFNEMQNQLRRVADRAIDKALETHWKENYQISHYQTVTGAPPGVESWSTPCPNRELWASMIVQIMSLRWAAMWALPDQLSIPFAKSASRKKPFLGDRANGAFHAFFSFFQPKGLYLGATNNQRLSVSFKDSKVFAPGPCYAFYAAAKPFGENWGRDRRPLTHAGEFVVRKKTRTVHLSYVGSFAYRPWVLSMQAVPMLPERWARIANWEATRMQARKATPWEIANRAFIPHDEKEGAESGLPEFQHAWRDCAAQPELLFMDELPIPAWISPPSDQQNWVWTEELGKTRETRQAVSKFDPPEEDGSRIGPAAGFPATTYEDLAPAEKGLKEKFGIGEVNYGRWVDPSERVFHLEGVWGALWDQSEMTLFPKDKAGHSFAGPDLGIGIGSRGEAGAAAHSESWGPAPNTINITKMAGKGAWVHEWGHYLDKQLWTLANYLHGGAGSITDMRLREVAPWVRYHKGLKKYASKRFSHPSAMLSAFILANTYLHEELGLPSVITETDDEGEVTFKLSLGTVPTTSLPLFGVLRDDAEVSWPKSPKGHQTGGYASAMFRNFSDLTAEQVKITNELSQAAVLVMYTIMGQFAPYDEEKASPLMRDAVRMGLYYATPTELFARSMEAYAALWLDKRERQSGYLVAKKRQATPHGYRLEDPDKPQTPENTHYMFAYPLDELEVDVEVVDPEGERASPDDPVPTKTVVLKRDDNQRTPVYMAFGRLFECLKAYMDEFGWPQPQGAVPLPEKKANPRRFRRRRSRK